MSIKSNPNKPKTDYSKFGTGKFHQIRVGMGSVKFSKLYRLPPWKRYMYAGLIGILMAIVVQFCVKNTGLYNTGLSAIIQGFSRLIYVVMSKNGASDTTATTTFNFLFWVTYLILNIPLFIFAYFKIGKMFAKLTFFYLVLNTICGFAISSIPGTNDIFIFGKTLAGNSNNPLTLDHVYVMPFYFEGHPDLFDPTQDSIKSFFIFLYSIAYGIITSMVYAMLYIVGSCSAGLDIVSIYYATKKNTNISKMLMIINSISMVIGATMGSYFSAGLINSTCFTWQYFFSANLIASFLNIAIFGILLSRFFPLNKHVRVEIYSNKIKEIREYLYGDRYTHPLTIYKTIGGYSMQEFEMLVTICMYIELPKLVQHIRHIDQTCLIVATKVDDVDGIVNVYQQGSTE